MSDQTNQPDPEMEPGIPENIELLFTRMAKLEADWEIFKTNTVAEHLAPLEENTRAFISAEVEKVIALIQAVKNEHAPIVAQAEGAHARITALEGKPEFALIAEAVSILRRMQEQGTVGIRLEGRSVIHSPQDAPDVAFVNGIEVRRVDAALIAALANEFYNDTPDPLDDETCWRLATGQAVESVIAIRAAAKAALERATAA